MKTLKRPRFGVGDFFGLCTATLACDDKRRRMDDILDELVRREALYRLRGEAGELYRFKRRARIGDVSKKELSSLYTGTFVPKKGPTRSFYEALRRAPGNLCPLCRQRTVSTLDHYLPKARHPAFALTPLNLVPSCKDCNTDSRQKQAGSAHEQTLHPYFDGADSEVWLTAQVVVGSPPTVKFSTAPVPGWSAQKNAMVATHLRTYNLDALYADNAAGELVNVYIDVDQDGVIDDPKQIAQHLAKQARKRRKAFRNSWQGALYQALADSPWFCEHGIHDIVASELFPEDYEA